MNGSTRTEPSRWTPNDWHAAAVAATTVGVELSDAIAQVAALVPGPPIDAAAIALTGSASFSSAFDVDLAVRTAAGLSNLCAGVTTLDLDRLAAMLTTHVELDGQPVPAWADLSGYYDAADGGRIQLHCNFPHHAQGIVDRLGCEPDRDAVQRAVSEWDAAELETVLIDDGMIAARLRTMAEWAAHPHAVATAGLPVISVERIGDGPPRPGDHRLRVLDCTRVLAGPIAGMTLAAHGADVLRVGARDLPSVEACVLATGFGKRNAFVDVRAEPDRFGALLDGADVWIDAYRPGAFAAHGFPPERASEGAVVVQICAFDWVGPWAGRRGFDSIVQSTTGIVDAGTRAAGRDHPVPLPVQALDYCTGLLAAFAANQLVRHQREHGGTWLARLSLLRTRNWLVELGGPTAFEPARPVVHPEALHTVPTSFGQLTAALPIGGSFACGPQPLGSSQPVWLASP
jgi:crotonobetainyl-CoA:carnitine CoA-transferase CaiB-like acyl-CoA transferase